MKMPQTRGLSALLKAQTGALMVEYLVVTSVGLMIALALLGLGAALVDGVGHSLQILYSEYP